MNPSPVVYSLRINGVVRSDERESYRGWVGVKVKPTVMMTQGVPFNRSLVMRKLLSS